MTNSNTGLTASAFLVAACAFPSAQASQAWGLVPTRGATAPLQNFQSTRRSSSILGFVVRTSQIENTSDASSYPLQQAGDWKLAEIGSVVLKNTSEIHAVQGVLSNPTELSSSLVEILTSIADRKTTDRELAIAEIRSWRLLEEDWDGEGALKPNLQSVLAASNVVCSLPNSVEIPAPMLHSTGRASLLWRSEAHYAHIEFLGSDRVAYYIERGPDKHKGVVGVILDQLPQLLLDLLPNQGIAT